MKHSEYKFSPKEEEMFKILGLEEELGFAAKGLTSPLRVYQWAVNKCFLEKTEGLAVESLRKLFECFGNGTAVRLTPEWDALIQLEEDSLAEVNELATKDDRSLSGWADIILKEKK